MGYRIAWVVWALCASAATAHTAPQAPAASQQPARDTSAQKKSPLAKVSGRVFAADTGRPLKRARVLATAAELPRGRAALTDDTGAFDLSDLPAGRYTVTVSKTGFISLSYGQRRPLQAGTPLQLGEGQQLNGVDFRLPRGGAVAGRIADEDGEPMPGVTVRVMRYQYLQGDRRLVPAGTAQTDDQGQYRVWGLMPGTYYVTATARGFGTGGGRAGGPAGGRFGAPYAGPTEDQDAVTYAPTYFPGVGSVNEANPVALGISQELLDIGFGLLLVRTARVSGQITNPGGTPATSGNVLVAADETAGGGRGQIVNSYGTRIQRNGTFSITGVPPGRYMLRARGADGDRPLYGQQPLTVGGDDVSGVSVVLAPGGSISGTIAFQSVQTSPPSDVTQLRVTAPSADQSALGVNPTARVERNSQFTLVGVAAGLHFIRSNSAQGWTLKSVIINGRDVIDVPVDVLSGQTLNNVSLVYTDKLAQLSGSVTTEQSVPVTDSTVLAFPADETLWRPESRQIMTARPDQNGRFQIHGLPAGDYYLALVDPAEQGEWFEPSFLQQHQAGAIRLTLAEGDVKTQDFRIKN